MAPQTVVLDQPVIGLEGDPAYPGRPKSLNAGVNGDAVAIAFGRGIVTNGTDDETFVLPAADTDILTGYFHIAYRDPTKDGGGPYAVGEKLTAARKGFYWVQVEDAVVQGGPVFCRYAAGGNGLGAFRSDAGTTEAAQVPNAVFASSQAVADGLAIVELF